MTPLATEERVEGHRILIVDYKWLNVSMESWWCVLTHAEVMWYWQTNTVGLGVMALTNTEVLGRCGTEIQRSNGATWYWETAQYFGGVVKTISEILRERPGSLTLCPPKMLNILPLEANWVFVMKNLTLIAWNMANCFSVAPNSHYIGSCQEAAW
jgi:hypothetical protein